MTIVKGIRPESEIDATEPCLGCGLEPVECICPDTDDLIDLDDELDEWDDCGGSSCWDSTVALDDTDFGDDR